VAWRTASGKRRVGELAASFRLDIGMIRDAAALARTASAARGAPVSPESLWSAAGAASSSRIGELARRLMPGPTWSDLILPERQATALHTLSAFLRHRDRVIADWGYAPIAGERGLTALFAGESGTGKTMAARVLATESGLDVYRVDLSSLFSKWVGETEKNLDRIFGSAERSNAILFFDEADVVFGKRTESSDSSDRYANLETAFLLQRIEGYDGIVVLATNLRSNMDDAFVRRLDIVIDFPPPDVDTRRRLWEALLPAQAPTADDIDLEFLATRFELSGGGIRNCSLAAALLAADEGDMIHMHHLIRAVAIEFTKLGRLTIEADFGRFHEVATKGPHSIASLDRGTKARQSARSSG
jgi:AAA+ superfamily predicted ATPase